MSDILATQPGLSLGDKYCQTPNPVKNWELTLLSPGKNEKKSSAHKKFLINFLAKSCNSKQISLKKNHKKIRPNGGGPEILMLVGIIIFFVSFRTL